MNLVWFALGISLFPLYEIAQMGGYKKDTYRRYAFLYGVLTGTWLMVLVSWIPI